MLQRDRQNSNRLGLTLAAKGQRALLGLRVDYGDLPVDIGCPRQELLFAFGAEALRLHVALGPHTSKDVLLGGLWEVRALDADVHDLEAEALRLHAGI